MNSQTTNPEHEAEADYAAKLLGQHCYDVILKVESLSLPWVMHNVPTDHSFGRLPGELEIRPWPIPRATGFLLNFLIRTHRLKSGVEIGTSLGYSSLFLGSALAANNGQLVTCEIFQPKLELAKKHIADSGLSNITILEGDAKITLRQSVFPLDFLFLDADPESYAEYFTFLAPRIMSGGLLIMDNAIDHNFLTEPFILNVLSSNEWDGYVLPFDHGLFIAHKR